MNRDLEAQIRQALKEAAATYSSLIGVQGLPAPLTRRVLAGRLLRATTVANLVESTAANEALAAIPVVPTEPFVKEFLP